MAGVTAAIPTIITLLFLTGLFFNLPEATLGAIVVHAVWNLIDFGKLERMWNVRKEDFWAAFFALVGVLLFGVLEGILIGIERGTGSQTLFVPTPGPVFATPIVVGTHLIAGTLSGELLIVDLNTGRLIATHRLHDSNKPFSSYFTPDPDSDLTPFQFTVANLKKMKTEQRAVLSLAIIGELVLLGTGSGDVLAFELDGLLKSG